MSFNPHTILGCALPTNEPKTAFDYILSSLEYFKEVAPITTFLFNFQAPWTDEDIKKAVDMCESYGFEVRYTYNSYTVEGRGLVPFNQIRHDACALMPEGKFFALTDDDFKYRWGTAKNNRSAGQQYVDTIHYLTTHEKCGLVLMGGSLFKKIPRHHIGPVDLQNTFITGHGYVMRSLGPDVALTLPVDALWCLGSDEEKVCAGARLSRGYYPAKFGNSRTLHYENHRGKDKTQKLLETMDETELETVNDGKITGGAQVYGWNRVDILDSNNNKFIRDNYNPKFKGQGYYNVVDTELYFKNGGIDVYDKRVVEEYTTDYTDRDSEEQIKEIIEYWTTKSEEE